jgi:hypothetical protein
MAKTIKTDREFLKKKPVPHQERELPSQDYGQPHWQYA